MARICSTGNRTSNNHPSDVVQGLKKANGPPGVLRECPFGLGELGWSNLPPRKTTMTAKTIGNCMIRLLRKPPNQGNAAQLPKPLVSDSPGKVLCSHVTHGISLKLPRGRSLFAGHVTTLAAWGKHPKNILTQTGDQPPENSPKNASPRPRDQGIRSRDAFHVFSPHVLHPNPGHSRLICGGLLQHGEGLVTLYPTWRRARFASPTKPTGGQTHTP